MAYGDPKDPVVMRIEVFPKERTMVPQAEQQLTVIARYSDGHIEDVTRGALFEANDKDMATAEPSGLVKFASQPGDVGIMIRYQSKVAVFRATVPLGAPVQHLPIAKNFVDESVFKKLKRIGLPPSEIADDATFIRRLTLDLAGRLPNADETSAFLADKSATKRDVLIDRLLASGDYADYFANFWGALLRNQRSSINGRTEPYMRGTFAFHSWIRDSLASNKPYDQFAREVLAASGDIAENPPVAWYRQVKTAQNQLEDAAQLFLGLRLQCAQCHHHPYEKWSQADYYSFGAFFSQVSRKPGSQPGEELVFAKRGAPTMANKKNNVALKPAGLGEKPLDIPADEDARHALWTKILARLDTQDVKIKDLVKATEGFTPGDIELASQRAASIAFDRARKGIEPSHITSYDFVQSISRTNASITSQIAKQFAEESKKFGRA